MLNPMISHILSVGMARYQAAALFFKLQVLPGVALSIGHALDLRQARGFDDLWRFGSPSCWENLLRNPREEYRLANIGRVTNIEEFYPLVINIDNIAIENDPFIVDLPIKDGDFP